MASPTRTLHRKTGLTSGTHLVSARPIRACRTLAHVGSVSIPSVCRVLSTGSDVLANTSWVAGDYDVARILDELDDFF